MDIIITIALIILCVIGVILMKTGIDIQIKKEGLEHRRDLYKIWSGVTKEPSLCDNARIYISGPMTDRQTGKVSKENIEAFYRAEQRLRDAGNVNIINPARVWACRWPWLYRIVGYRPTLWYDLQLLKRCDAIYLLNGWKDSVGAYAEFSLAFRRGLYMMTEKTDINTRFYALDFIGTLVKKAWEKDKIRVTGKPKGMNQR